MKKSFCIIASACLIFMTGCGQRDLIEDISSDIQEDVSEPEQHNVDIEYVGEDNVDSVKVTTISFVNGMGCSDTNCTDASHHHDCPSDCGDYEHHHNCGLDCTEESHHHAYTEHEETHHAESVTVTNVSFVSGMGCSDPDCTDVTHHHDCPLDCGDYEHHHNCALDCTIASHHHSGTSTVSGTTQHHTAQSHSGQHHKDDHH